MTTLTVTAKGQVTFRKEVLQHLGINPGDKLEVDLLPNRRIEARAERKKGDISAVFGCIKAPEGVHLSIEDMNEIIARGWAGEL